MKIVDADHTWRSVTIGGSDEIWDVHQGYLLVSTDASPATRLGIRLSWDGNATITIRAGLTVFYKLASAESSSALVAREAL